MTAILDKQDAYLLLQLLEVISEAANNFEKAEMVDDSKGMNKAREDIISIQQQIKEMLK